MGRGRILLAAGIAVTLTSASAQTMVIIDNVDPGFSETGPDWKTGTSSGGYGADYRFVETQSYNNTPLHSASWQAPISETGFFDVAVQHAPGANRSDNAPFTIITDHGQHTVHLNQQVNGGQFNSLGTFHFDAGEVAEVRLSNDANPIVVMADAVRLTRITTETLRNEYRFFWVSRFQWPSGNQAVAKANIQNVFQTAADYNFNAVFFQIRGQMDTHYPSPHEPWSNTYNWTNPGWDPLAYALEQAHYRDLELHAYFNTHTLAGPVPPTNTSPQHNYNVHGPRAAPGADRWEAHDIFGNPIPTTDGYIWLSPGVPEASYHTRRELMYLVDTYNIDGVHFDRIRTSRPDVSYDPISVSRFNGDGNPDDLRYPEFMRDQITRDMRKIYGAIQYSKPNIAVSAAPIGISRRNSDTNYQGWGTPGYYSYNQDAWGWLKAHVMDFMVPQIYWEINSNHPYEKLLADWIANSGGRWIVPGSRTAKTIAGEGPKPLAGLLGEWQTAVDLGAAGNCYWQWASLADQPPGEFQNYYEALKQGPYKNKVSPPEMPWKTNPTTGYITGYVLDENGAPVVDARVKLTGDDYTYLTAWDGFFSILDVAPGSTHSLTATKFGAGSAELTAVEVTAGDVTSQTLQLEPRRGFVEFFRTRYYHDDVAEVRLFDADLAAAPIALVYVYGPNDAAGETIALAAEGGGRFRGTISLDAGTNVPGDQKLRAMPGTVITAQYNDADNGTGSGSTVHGLASVRIPADVIVESRIPQGGVSPLTVYFEDPVLGSWLNTGTVAPNSRVIKSHASGLSGQGGRISTQIAKYTFYPRFETSGYYNAYVTIPGPEMSTSYKSPGTQVEIKHAGGQLETTADLSSTNEAAAGKWMLLAADLKFNHLQNSWTSFKNTDPPDPPNEVFGADAVRFVFQRPLGVNAGVDGWEKY